VDLALGCGTSSDAISPFLMRAAAFLIQNMAQEVETLNWLRPRMDPFLSALYQLTITSQEQDEAGEDDHPMFLAFAACLLIPTLVKDHVSYFQR